MDLVINMAEITRRDLYIRIDLDIFLQLEGLTLAEWQDLPDFRKQIMVQKHLATYGQAVARTTADVTSENYTISLIGED